jgi:predicted RNA-binding protein with PIN domain
MHIVIDGYNLIRRSARFGALDLQDLQSGRDALVDALAAYKKIKAFEITVVFDGMAAAPGMQQRDKHKGIVLHYSRAGETADAVIKQMARSQKHKLLVVSSDHEITDYAAANGAGVISTEEFEKRMVMAQLMEMDGGLEDDDVDRPSGTQKKGPARRTSKRQRKMHRKIGKL